MEKDSIDWAGNIRELTGYTHDEFGSVSLKFWLSHIHPEDLNRFLEKYDEYMRSGNTFSSEYRLRKKNGEYIYLEDNGVCLRDEEGVVYKILGVVKDITEKKQAEESLAKIEIVRKQEIHHRIKNNLQVISSLLDLQAETFRDKATIKNSEVLKAFRESQNRVKSMALIHEELYKGGGFEMLNFSPYIEKLAENLFQAYRLGNKAVSLNMDLDENLFFDMDTAVPLGIIVNELVSNSLKHAFADKDKGEIRINLSREESDEGAFFTLTVYDNGIGISENIDIEDLDSLGLQLVTILVDQLDGELELQRNNGTEFTMRFTVRTYALKA
jgi:PAS domain S-box-containing protein